jgi:hypothetical protein
MYSWRITFNVESILHLSSRVLLRYEHSVEVPESGFYELVGGHLSESGRTFDGMSNAPESAEYIHSLTPYRRKSA